MLGEIYGRLNAAADELEQNGAGMASAAGDTIHQLCEQLKAAKDNVDNAAAQVDAVNTDESTALSEASGAARAAGDRFETVMRQAEGIAAELEECIGQLGAAASDLRSWRVA